MTRGEFVSLQAWLAELLETHAREIRERGLIVQRELDAGFVAQPSEALEAALRGLLDFVFLTTPDHCEIYLSAARKTAPVARLGSGTVTMRWQVAGERLTGREIEAVALRPVPGDPADHLRSERRHELARAFADAGWIFELSAPPMSGELLARVQHA